MYDVPKSLNFDRTICWQKTLSVVLEFHMIKLEDKEDSKSTAVYRSFSATVSVLWT